MWHRGDRAKGRDLFDLCAVAAAEPEQLRIAEPFLVRHGAVFLRALIEREDVLRREFAEIDAIGAGLDFAECVKQAETVIRPLWISKRVSETHRCLDIVSAPTNVTTIMIAEAISRRL